MKKNSRYFVSKRKSNLVMKVGLPNNKGFSKVMQGISVGVELIGEHIIEEQYEECSYDYFKKYIERRRDR